MTTAPDTGPTVEITADGRGGMIVYLEQGHRIAFSWEFAMPPSIALVFGPSAGAFDRTAPWAAGRRAEVYDTVGREVVRQKAPGGDFIVDLDRNMIDVLKRRG
jgi:hypothetical protein